MRKYSGFFKRAQSWVLTVAIMLSVLAPTMGWMAFAETDPTETLTDGQIVANNYDLTQEEKQLIGSGLLIGATHTYNVPQKGDGLVSVDTDEKKITAIAYEGTKGYEWKPVSAKVLVGEEVKETLALNKDGVATYTYDGNAFSVSVEYQLYVTVDAATQQLLLNAPAYLKQGIDNLDDIAQLSANLALVEQALPYFRQAAGSGLWINVWGNFIQIKFDKQEACDATKLLYNQTQKNADNKLDLTVMIDAYKQASNKTQYLLENGAAMKAKAEETLKALSVIREDPFFGLIDSAPGDTNIELYKMVRNAIGSNDPNSEGTGCIEVLKAVLADSWDAVDPEKNIVKGGLSEIEYIALDLMVMSLNELTDVSKIEIKEELLASSTSIRYDMNMFEVAVKVVLNVTDNSNKEVAFKQHGSMTTTVVLAENATAAEIEDAIDASGIVDEAKTAWAGVFVEGKFVKDTTDLPAKLTQDIDYVVTYSPAYYDVQFAYGTVEEYPYGYIFALDNHTAPDKVYDYTVTDEENPTGKYYPQGAFYTVTGDATVARKEGKPYKNYKLYQILADNYLTVQKGVDILTSGALFGDEEISVRYPDNTNGIVKLNGNLLLADTYSASYEGLSWAPYSYKLSDGTVGYFEGNGSVEIDKEFESVTVTYRLYLSNFDQDTVKELINLPFVLNQEANQQLEALQTITAQKENLGMLNSMMLDILAGLIQNTELNDDAQKNQDLKDCFGSVLAKIKNECMNGSELYLYTFVDEYSQQKNKLRYYYENHKLIRGEVAKFADYMNALVGNDEKLTADEKIAALATLMGKMPSNMMDSSKIEGYIGQLSLLGDTMAEVKENLSAPNEKIQLDSDHIGNLLSALQQAGELEYFDTLPEEKPYPYLEDSSIVAVADNKAVITVTVQVEGGKSFTVISKAIPVNDEVSAATVNDMIAEIKAKLAEQGVVEQYYKTTFDEASLLALVGQKAGDIVTEYEYYWTYASFAVLVPGMEEQWVTLKDLDILLAPSTDPAYRLDYTVDGVPVADKVLTLTLDQFNKVINNTLTITVNKVYVLREDLINYVNGLNAAVGNGQLTFALVENNGEFSIVMKIDAAAPAGLMGSAQGAAMGMVQGKYTYVGLGGNAMLADGKVYLQTIVDALLNSGFGTGTIIDAIDANGNIRSMKLNGTVVTDKSLGVVGGKLLETTMQLGNSPENVNNLKMYVTLGSAPAQLTQVRNLLAKVEGSFGVVCQDGKATVSVNLPEKLYEAYLAVLLVTDRLDLSNVNDVNGEIAVGFLNDYLVPLFQGDVTLETFENTFKKFGYNWDIDSIKGAKALFDIIDSFYSNADITFEEKSGIIAGVLNIKGIINSLNLGPLGDIIAEKETGLKIAMEFKMEDLGKQYEAIYVDVRADGVTNKAGLTNDVVSKVNGLSGISMIVLLSDVEGDLNFKNTTLLNLNGFTVNGNVTASGRLIVIDTHIGNDKDGGVNGKISGNVDIVAGKYTANVSAFLGEGYVQDNNGVVNNKFYNIVRDAQGNITVELNAALMHTKTLPNIKNLVIDIVCDLIFNGYTTNYLAIDGNTVYDITIEDFVGLYAANNRLDAGIEQVLSFINSPQLSTLINKVLDDVFNFTAISEAIANDEAIFSYTMTTGAWDLQLQHVKDGDYLTVSLAAGQQSTGNLNVVIVGEQADKDFLVEMFEELGRTVNADINLNLNHGLANGTIFAEFGADANVFVDFTNPNYAIMLSIIVADGIGSPANADLIAGIKNFYETNNIAMLRWAFNELTTKQVLTAMKNFNLNDNITSMIASLGLKGIVDNRVAELEVLYDRVGKLVCAVVRKADLDGNNRKIGTLMDANGVYGLSKENIDKLIKRGLVLGYSGSVEISIDEVSFGIQLFGSNIIPLKPEFVDGTGTPEILDNNKVAGYYVDYVNKYIFIDAAADGITVQELMAVLQFHAVNTDKIGLVFNNGTLAADDLIVNGTTVTATATNRISSQTDVVEYTIIMVGDANGDGKVNVGDMILINRALVELETLDALQALAADINNNGRIDIGDAVGSGEKYVDWEAYISSYDNKKNMKGEEQK